MIRIRKVEKNDIKLLVETSIQSFLPPHGHSAPKKEIDKYLAENFNEKVFLKDISANKNRYYFIFSDDKIAGYSKITLDKTTENVASNSIACLSRIYLLQEFYGKGLGEKLFDFNVSLCKKNDQKGIWLAVWVENQKAINFYKKIGFKKIGSLDFRVSKNYTNPNHVLYLPF